MTQQRKEIVYPHSRDASTMGPASLAALGSDRYADYLERSLHRLGASPAQGVVDMSGWLIFLIVVAIVVLLLLWRNRGRRGSGRSGGTVDPGERWRTGGYGGG